MLEQPTELDRLNRTLSKLEILRETLLDPDLFNSSLLEDYAKEVAEAVQNGIDPWNNESRWSAMKSVFFASTVLTTIGYGDMAPATTEGRVFCIVFAMIGIPIALTAITNLGRLLATLISSFYRRFRTSCKWIDRLSKSAGISSGGVQSKGVYVVAGVGLLALYIAMGGGLFMIWEDWSFSEAFYFCFITMSTIGFGDLVPQQQTYVFLCTLYILVGLALTSTIFELVRRQYAESWERMKELSEKLADLSGPLSDTLKRLGDQAHRYGGDISIDMNLMKDLRDLRKAVAMTKFELEWKAFKKHGKKPPDSLLLPEDTDEPVKVVWIIYESNV
ncbi:unnamed protein product [Darwinula stevensoni]|uniref:Potassium channel domain-containing protein n=1 Tax=Darwinula stevensoni TaxID=69355 RepID=A0A7R9A354_9CRUS|nr:unnamed protein product [Darwinula stevensoni]CAG0890040.1 unnamed protein product [Darwinula stevensoni]